LRRNVGNLTGAPLRERKSSRGAAVGSST